MVVSDFAGEGVAAAMAGEAAQVRRVTPERPAHVPSSVASGPRLSHQTPAGGRASNSADFLERVGLAEKRDEWDAIQLQQARRQPSTLNGILSPERPHAGGASPGEASNPTKARGVCNPELGYYMPNTRAATGGVQYMPNMGGKDNPSKYLGAAGASSSEAWRSSHNYMAHGAEGYGDVRSEHLALQSKAKGQARNLQPPSNVVFGGDAGGLYPHSPTMIRGKYPGY